MKPCVENVIYLKLKIEFFIIINDKESMNIEDLPKEMVLEICNQLRTDTNIMLNLLHNKSFPILKNVLRLFATCKLYWKYRIGFIITEPIDIFTIKCYEHIYQLRTVYMINHYLIWNLLYQ